VLQVLQGGNVVVMVVDTWPIWEHATIQVQGQGGTGNAQKEDRPLLCRRRRDSDTQQTRQPERRNEGR